MFLREVAAVGRPTRQTRKSRERVDRSEFNVT
jgi:hypothetical protein